MPFRTATFPAGLSQAIVFGLAGIRAVPALYAPYGGALGAALGARRTGGRSRSSMEASTLADGLP